MQTALILALIAVLFGLWAWLSDKATRFMLHLYGASCPHCHEVGSLDPVKGGYGLELDMLLPGDERGPLYACRQCGEMCHSDDIFPKAEEKAPERPTAA